MGPSIPWAKKYFSWTGAVLAIGLGLRLYHYLRNPSMWHDEAALVLNVLDKDFRALLGPLSFSEAAPPLFLWIERAVALGVGDGTYALRLVPFLASCATLLLFAQAACSVLRPAAVPWAVLLFACSDHVLWHSCEAKPYAVDIFAATALLAVFCATASWTPAKRLIIWGCLGPVMIFLVYPGCFLCGGLLIALWPDLRRARPAKLWLGYGLLVLGIFAAFALLLAGPIKAQRCETILACWRESFPCWEKPWTVPRWTALAVLEVFRYGFEPVGQTLLPFAVAGGVRWWRRGLRPLLVLALLPIVLPLAAAYLHAYPFGGSRVVVYVTPALALLIAEGLPLQPALPPGLHLRAFCQWGALLLALLPLAWSAYRVIDPWHRADCAAATQYVMAHRQPSDGVTANHWEYVYYFRGLGSAFCLIEHGLPVEQGRLWLIATANTPADRFEILNYIGQQGWQMLEQREFRRTSVVLFSKRNSKTLSRP